MKVAVFSAQPYDQRFFDEVLQREYASSGFELIYQKAALTDKTVSLAQGCTAICAFVNDQLDAALLEQLADYGVRAILLRCAGFNNIDLPVAERLGLFVARVPAYSPEAVAEHAIALVMTLNRNIHRAYNRVREGNFMLDGLLGFNLHGKTVGIVGTGKIGLATARIFKGFGCRVLGYDPYQTADFSTVGEYVPLDTLLAEADVVSLHCPLTEATRHLINADSLARMKLGAMLVNTSRGMLIDTKAVIGALKSRRLRALAIDVYEQESQLFFQDRSSDLIDDEVFLRLTTFPNVIITGHQGFFTIEALREIAEVTLHNLDCFANDRACGNILPIKA
ncbi:2-hydroxyacid dehydrogenase [Azomonas macrocytogenes]|uniref:D-lactate dehydrogenase n=1 Tax=Azomonas macrocytogenes TaxID=69962 RepID=A0A839T1L3_AZOMA|nr:2-hydroxyacid dehydrogenase [Azomonas macrocytogenes]MBB3103292.1 D-lactate dehydrogenase [Azomonas macrocytogenes]